MAHIGPANGMEFDWCQSFIQLNANLPLMDLLPDTQNCALCMRRKCRERFPPSPILKETAS